VANDWYVGNLRYGMTSADLHDLFERDGTVQAAQVIVDRDTWRSQGFGFVEMASEEAAQAALNGRTLTVKEVRPREEQFLCAPGEQFANDYFG
jgi:cold-inducible RNA-binding protein